MMISIVHKLVELVLFKIHLRSVILKIKPRDHHTSARRLQQLQKNNFTPSKLRKLFEWLFCPPLPICFNLFLQTFPWTVNRGRYLLSNDSQGLLAGLSLPVKVFQGYDDDAQCITISVCNSTPGFDQFGSLRHQPHCEHRPHWKLILQKKHSKFCLVAFAFVDGESNEG